MCSFDLINCFALIQRTTFSSVQIRKQVKDAEHAEVCLSPEFLKDPG